MALLPANSLSKYSQMAVADVYQIMCVANISLPSHRCGEDPTGVFYFFAHSKVREMKDSKTVHFYNKYSCGSRVQKVEENRNKISAISQIAILKQEEETLTWNSNNQST